jgi:hypothetical protein
MRMKVPYSKKPAQFRAGFLLRLDSRGRATNIICSFGIPRPKVRVAVGSE